MRKALARFFSPLRKWWLLVVLASLAGLTAGYLGARTEAPLYATQVTLMVGNALQQPNPETGETQSAMLLSYTYAELARSEPIAAAARESLDLAVLPRYISYALWDAPFVNIEVAGEDPQLIATVANELARQLVLKSPATTQTEINSQLAFLEQQLAVTQKSIEQAKQDILQAQADLAKLQSATQIIKTQTRIGALESKLAGLETNYANMLGAIQEGIRNQVIIFAPAQAPLKPYGPKIPQILLLTSLSGFLLAVGAAYLYEGYDVSVKTAEEAGQLTGVPVLGVIGNMPGERTRGIYVSRHPHAPDSDAFRSLRTNIEYLLNEKNISTLLVTSSSPREGKSTITANLSASLALGDRQVVLLDADLRRPMLHKTLGISNLRGVSEVYRGMVPLDDALVSVGVPRLQVLTSGDLPPNPAELIASHRFTALLDDLVARSELVVVDGPPATIADAMNLAGQVDGVVLVVRAGYTPRDALMEAVRQLELVDANVVGMVINRSPEAARSSRPLGGRIQARLRALVNRALGRQTLLPQRPPKYPLPRRKENGN